MMWDFSGSASNGQSPPSYPEVRSRAISPAPPTFPPAPGGFAFASSAPAPQPFMPIGAPEDHRSSYGSSYFNNDVGPWVAPSPNPAPISREPVASSGSYSVHIHYRSHRRHSHSHSQSYTHPPAVRPPPSAPSGHHDAPPPPPPPRASQPHRPYLGLVQHLMPSLPSGSGNRHSFQYSRCTGKKRALCIGINYKGQQNELYGCVNDARNVQRFLHRYHGFKPENIRMLTDDTTHPHLLPTRVNILDAMHWLVEGAEPHDSLFFHYSGHGGQVKDRDGDEVDGFDEVIFPLDYKRAGFIVDDLMHVIMVKKLPAGCRLTALFDSCHSGSVLDLPYLYGSDGRVKGSQVTPRWISRKSTPADVITWSGCKDSQTSADTWEDGSAVGAMSYAFMSSLRQNPNQSYQELLRSVRVILKKKYSQKAQLSSSHHIDTNLKFII